MDVSPSHTSFWDDRIAIREHRTTLRCERTTIGELPATIFARAKVMSEEQTTISGSRIDSKGSPGLSSRRHRTVREPLRFMAEPIRSIPMDLIVIRSRRTAIGSDGMVIGSRRTIITSAPIALRIALMVIRSAPIVFLDGAGTARRSATVMAGHRMPVSCAATKAGS